MFLCVLAYMYEQAYMYDWLDVCAFLSSVVARYILHPVQEEAKTEVLGCDSGEFSPH